MPDFQYFPELDFVDVVVNTILRQRYAYMHLSLGKNIEASVAVYNDMLVVASYNQKIYGIKLS